MNKSIAIVGNGPSAAEFVDEIESSDFVVRINNWKQKSGMKCGKKIDAILVHRQDSFDGFTDEEQNRMDLEVWCNISVEDLRYIITEERPGDLRFLVTILNGKPLRFIRHKHMQELNEKLSSFLDREVCGTAGLMAIFMAYDMKRWNEFRLFGMDAIKNIINYPGKNSEEALEHRHDMLAEKKMLQEFEKKEDIEVKWFGKPEIKE